MTTIRCELKSYIQPFERRLALAEMERLVGGPPMPVSGPDGGEEVHFNVRANGSADRLRRDLAYWEGVGDQPTMQVLREATAEVSRSRGTLQDVRKAIPFHDLGEAPTPNRRSLRYGPHGLHEYRGKFFPQLVKSLINIGQVPRDGVILDPMCGSGTTPVEAMLAGRHSVGLDMNPLSVLMSRTKCELLTTDPHELEDSVRGVHHRIECADKGRPSHLRSLPPKDREYLQRWFAPKVLDDLDLIIHAINCVELGPARSLLLLSLSNILRSVSWQKEEDLRVRKELRAADEIDAIAEFLAESERSTRLILAFLYREAPFHVGSFNIREGSAINLAEVWPGHVGQVDAVITSPPYATALPYLDTDRLSLSFLGLLPRRRHRERDREMIGNREINKGIRERFWYRFLEEGHELPESVRSVILRIKTLNEGTGAGFRRQNLPALLAKYFFDMREVLTQIHRMLRDGGPAYVVVGDNHTIAGGQRVDIRTSELLAEVAESVGLRPSEHIQMDMLRSRDIFKNNAIASEVILAFRK